MEHNRGNKLVEAFFQFSRLKTLFPPPRGLPHGTMLLLHGIAYGGRGGRHMEMAQTEEGVRISAISRYTGMSMPAVSQLVNTLEDKKLLERYTSRSDRRAVYVRLTPQGNGYLKNQREDFFSLLDEVEEEFGEQNADELIELSSRLFHIVEQVQIQNKKQQEGKIRL